MMDSLRRQMIFAVMDEESANDRMLQAMHHVNNLVRADECLMWCIKNKLIGKRFLQFVDSCGGSIFSAMSIMLTWVGRERSRKPIIHGKDYVDNVVNFQSFNRGNK